jgi:hypothetical protein
VCVLNQKCNRDFVINYSESRLHDLSKRSILQEKYLQKEDVLINSTGTGTIVDDAIVVKDTKGKDYEVVLKKLFDDLRDFIIGFN